MVIAALTRKVSLCVARRIRLTHLSASAESAGCEAALLTLFFGGSIHVSMCFAGMSKAHMCVSMFFIFLSPSFYYLLFTI